MAMALTGCVTAIGQETLAPLGVDDGAPQTFTEMWVGFDPCAEPLEVETLREWEEDGVALRVVRYRIGIFKGRKAGMAAVYGYPKGGTKLPGLVQIHGGGQYADHRAPLYNAKRGYATISISWAGRISAPDYRVTPHEVKLFWDGKTDDPAYKLTTDWGALDAYHAPCRNPQNVFVDARPASWTLDAVESPRNSPWFLCTLGARRALTFLEQQPEVDADRLGVYGHSMGGKITVMTAAADPRVKAAAPSCGGISDRDNSSALLRATIGDDVSLSHISCPIVFLSPSNDFHGRINDLGKAVNEIETDVWRLTCAAHHNHQDTEPYQVAGPLWFDQHLKHTFAFPQTPQAALSLKEEGGVPVFRVTPDGSRPILAVAVYYTQQGQTDGGKDDRENTIHRFWHHATARKGEGGTWTADMPLLTTGEPLWAYANVLYPLGEPVTGAGYYYGPYTATRFVLSSAMHIATVAQLGEAGVQATRQPSLTIESFEEGWQQEWFTYDLTGSWARRTHKIYDDTWKAPPFAKLAFSVRSEKPNKMVVGVGEFATEIQLNGGPEWQDIILFPPDFHDAVGRSFLDWTHAKELRLGPKEVLRSGRGAARKTLHLGADWQGAAPKFRNLRCRDRGTPYAIRRSWSVSPNETMEQ